MTSMDIFEDERMVSRADLAAWLRQVAAQLDEGRIFYGAAGTLAVADQVTCELEIESDKHGTEWSVEIEFSWTDRAAGSAPADATAEESAEEDEEEEADEADEEEEAEGGEEVAEQEEQGEQEAAEELVEDSGDEGETAGIADASDGDEAAEGEKAA